MALRKGVINVAGHLVRLMENPDGTYSAAVALNVMDGERVLPLKVDEQGRIVTSTAITLDPGQIHIGAVLQGAKSEAAEPWEVEIGGNAASDLAEVKAVLKAPPPEQRIYGASWDKGDSPTLTRTDSAVGMVAGVGVDGELPRNDFDTAPIWGEITEVMDERGNAFIRIPKCYIQKRDYDGLFMWRVCKTRKPGFYLPWCFWDFENGTELPYVDIGKYPASLDPDDKLASRAGTYPLVNETIVAFRNYAKANGDGYQQMDIHAYDLLTTLMLIEFATLDMQSVMTGYTAGQYSESHVVLGSEANTNRVVLTPAQANLYRVGQAISVGTNLGGNQVFYGRTITAIEAVGDDKALVFDGEPVDITEGNVVYNSGWRNGFSSRIAASSGSIVSNSSGLYPCSYRGIENPYGNVYCWIDGVNINDHQAWVCKNAEDYASNLFAGSAYEPLSYTNCDESGYVSTMGFDPENPYAQFPVAVGGSSSKYYSDYYYQSIGQRVALVGGRWSRGSRAGPSYWHLSFSASNAYVYCGGRLLKKPL